MGLNFHLLTPFIQATTPALLYYDRLGAEVNRRMESDLMSRLAGASWGISSLCTTSSESCFPWSHNSPAGFIASLIDLAALACKVSGQQVTEFARGIPGQLIGTIEGRVHQINDHVIDLTRGTCRTFRR